MTRSNVQLGGQELKLDADGDTSIQVSSDDVLVIDTAGSERMQIDASGRVGIGITPDTTSNGKSLQINRSIINDDDGGSTAALGIVVTSHFGNFEKINGRTTADNSQQRHFSSDKGFEFSALTIRDIKWGRE